MSRLIDKFHQASKAATPPMGFRTAHPAAEAPKILLIASLEAGAAGNPTEYLGGADAVLIRFQKTTPTVKTVQKITSSLPDIPWGLYPGDEDNKKAAEEGADFVVVPAASKVTETPGDEKTGKILEVESSMDDGLLRAVNDLPVDAVLADDMFQNKQPLVWHEMMIVQHLANLFSKPLIVPVPAGITEKELKILWDAGVDGIIVEADTAKKDGFKDLRRLIDKLPLRSGRKRGKINVILPRAAAETPTAAPPDEEEEEDE
jgi:hypothetical protein